MSDPLAALAAAMDWDIFTPVLERMPRAEPRGLGGHPAHAPAMMFKILVLQSLYSLSDEQAQFQILDRRSFHHFPGLSAADRVPDQNTIREFREKLTAAQKRSTRAKSRHRARVEHLFGFMTGSMRAMFQWCVGYVRNRAGILLANLVYHMARTEQIIRLKLLGRRTPALA